MELLVLVIELPPTVEYDLVNPDLALVDLIKPPVPLALVVERNDDPPLLRPESNDF